MYSQACPLLLVYRKLQLVNGNTGWPQVRLLDRYSFNNFSDTQYKHASLHLNALHYHNGYDVTQIKITPLRCQPMKPHIGTQSCIHCTWQLKSQRELLLPYKFEKDTICTLIHTPHHAQMQSCLISDGECVLFHVYVIVRTP